MFLGDGLEVAYTLLLPTSHWSKFNHGKILANLWWLAVLCLAKARGVFLFERCAYFFVTVLGLGCCVWAFSSWCGWGLVALRRLLTVAASPAGEHGLGSCGPWA